MSDIQEKPNHGIFQKRLKEENGKRTKGVGFLIYYLHDKEIWIVDIYNI